MASALAGGTLDLHGGGCQQLAAPGRRDQPGPDPPILAVFDAGYDIARLAWLLNDLPIQLCGRLRSDRVLYFRRRPGGGMASRAARPGTAASSGSPMRAPGPLPR